uniref:Uncharacterized protein n=1 Tax=Oryza sativa subsp. japonica TaxID=39947 RepID=Q6F2T1_ORYSJ|nr:hypothetical protein [Oryza sativa Japonica Group]
MADDGGRFGENPSPMSASTSPTRCPCPWLSPRPTRTRWRRQQQQPLAGMKNSFVGTEDDDEVGPGMKYRWIYDGHRVHQEETRWPQRWPTATARSRGGGAAGMNF